MRLTSKEAAKCIKPESFAMTKSANDKIWAAWSKSVLPIRETIETLSEILSYSEADILSLPMK